MPISLVSGRQSVLIAEVAFTYEDLADNVAEPAVNLPAGSTIVGGGVYVDTAWNSATSDVADVGDGDVANQYTPGGQVDLTIVGYQPLDVKGLKYTDREVIYVKWNGSGTAPSAGAGRLQVWYTIEGRATEVNPGS